MDVEIVTENGNRVKNAVNTDSIIRFGPNVDGNGSYIKLSDGTSIHVADEFSEILETVLKADSK